MSCKAKVIIIFPDAKGKCSSNMLQQTRTHLGKAMKWWDRLVIGGKTIFYFADRPISRSYVETLVREDQCFPSEKTMVTI